LLASAGRSEWRIEQAIVMPVSIGSPVEAIFFLAAAGLPRSLRSGLVPPRRWPPG
jgi:hypothetical protein